ncbi:MAG TPA: IclR family transcriptional regulator [Alphaproteobacteria bacterium]|jgi:DNA-binding IclR family transcriptional regulator
MKIKKPRKAKTTSSGNRTVVTGISLIKIVSDCGGSANLTEIARAARMLPMRTQRYLKALVETELIAYNEASGRYDLGPAVIELGLTALGRLNSVQIASDVIHRLTEQTGLVSLLSVWGSHGSTVIKYEQGTLSSVLRVREGSNLPLLTSATGRVFLTYMPAADTRDVLKRELTSVRNNGHEVDAGPAALEALKHEIQQHGMARGAGGTGHDTFAAPVFDHEGRLVMVITLLSVAGTFDTSYNGQLARQLKAAAEDTSRKLGMRSANRANTAPAPQEVQFIEDLKKVRLS